MVYNKLIALQEYGSLETMPDNLRIALFGYNEYEEYTEPLWIKYQSTLDLEKKIAILDDIISYDYQIYQKTAEYYWSVERFTKTKLNEYQIEPEVAEALLATLE